MMMKTARECTGWDGQAKMLVTWWLSKLRTQADSDSRQKPNRASASEMLSECLPGRKHI